MAASAEVEAFAQKGCRSSARSSRGRVRSKGRAYTPGRVRVVTAAAAIAACVGLLLVVPVATGLGSGIALLPVVGCKTEDAAAGGLPLLPRYLSFEASAPGGLSAQLRAKLAWYEGDIEHEPGLKVLAPRGWGCSALLAADGGWSLTVIPPGAQPQQEVEISGRANGPGASLACDYFPAAAEHSPVPGACKAPRGATITHESSHLVSVVTAPAGLFSVVTGNGELVSERTALTGRSFLYGYPAAGLAAEGAQCVLRDAQPSVSAAILSDAETRLGRALAAATKK